MDFTSLPNWHPAFVHFPIALVPLALFFDVGGLLLRKAEWLERAATAVWVLAGLAGFFAYKTGESAADGLVGVPASVEPLIGTHSDWGHWAFYGLAGFALLRLVVAVRDQERKKVWLRWALLVAGAALLAGVAYTADLGGQLVYGHGVAVAATSPSKTTDELRAISILGEDAPEGSPEETPEQAVDPSQRLRVGDDGMTVWRPAPNDGAALGTLITALDGTELDGTALDSVQTGEGDGDAGLTVTASGESWLALPGTFGDVRVEAEVDLSNFDGEIGLFHHAQGPDAAGLLVLSEGRQRLAEIRDQTTELDTAELVVPSSVFVLAVSAAGKHLKGLVDSATITHGHIEPGPEGRVGLMLRGEGTVRVLRLSAQPL